MFLKENKLSSEIRSNKMGVMLFAAVAKLSLSEKKK
jgi:hypothetical protein